METVYELDEDDRKSYNEFMECVQKTKKSYRIYPISVGLTAGLLFSPKGELFQVCIKRLSAAVLGYAMCSAVTTYISMSDCKHHLKEFMDKLESKQKMGETVQIQRPRRSQTLPATENISYSSDFNFPSNFSDDISSFKEDIHEEKEELTLQKKPITYKDLWNLHHDNVRSRLNEGKQNTGKPAGTPPTKPVPTNIYGDPLE